MKRIAKDQSEMPLHQPTVHQPPNGSTIISIDDVRNPTVKLAVAYWRSLCGQRRFPARADLTLRGSAAFLRHAIIIGVIENGGDYEYRYVGEDQRQAFVTYFKGIRVSQIEAAVPSLGALLRSGFEDVRATGTPFAVRGWIDSGSSDSKLPFHETAFLPLGTHVTTVDHLLLVGVFVPTEFWLLPADSLPSFDKR